MSRTPPVASILRRLGFGLFAVVFAHVSPVNAQTRFDVVAQESIPAMSGLRILTIRANRLAACYTLFVIDPATSPQIPNPAPTSDDEAKRQSIERLRAAAETRERQLAGLKAEFESKFGRSYEEWISPGGTAWNSFATAGVVDPLAITKYELERKKINDGYERVLRTEIASSYPPSVLIPGMRTGGWEDQSEGIRRSLLNPDPGTSRTLADKDGFTSELESWVQRLAEGPRLAAAGPTPCATTPLE